MERGGDCRGGMTEGRTADGGRGTTAGTTEGGRQLLSSAVCHPSRRPPSAVCRLIPPDLAERARPVPAEDHLDVRITVFPPDQSLREIIDPLGMIEPADRDAAVG